MTQPATRHGAPSTTPCADPRRRPGHARPSGAPAVPRAALQLERRPRVLQHPGEKRSETEKAPARDSPVVTAAPLPCLQPPRLASPPRAKPPDPLPPLPFLPQQPEFAGRLHVPEWYIQDPTDAQGIIPGTAEFASAREPKKVGLPLCASEDAPGRWVYTHHHYAEVRLGLKFSREGHQATHFCALCAALGSGDVPGSRSSRCLACPAPRPGASFCLPQNFGEPLVWRPYGCHHRHYSGLVLNQCVVRSAWRFAAAMAPTASPGLSTQPLSAARPPAPLCLAHPPLVTSAPRSCRTSLLTFRRSGWARSSSSARAPWDRRVRQPFFRVYCFVGSSCGALRSTPPL